MAVLDIQIVASSLPEIQAALHIPLDRLDWVQTSYLSAEIVAIPLTGWISGALSTRGAFVLCVLGFTAASAGCAAANGFWTLVWVRAVQGFFGGFLIPLVFSAVFQMFEDGPRRVRATMLAGVLAMLAPTLGPSVGGFVAARYSWHWLFLINLPPGLAVAALAGCALPAGGAEGRRLAGIDLAAAPLLALFLAGVQIILSEAPARGWRSPGMLALSALSLASGVLVILRCAGHRAPLIRLSAFRNRDFTLGCLFSFTLGVGLYGATYLLPLFLGIVRGHDPFEIGLIMIVTGAAELLTAPLATMLERRIDPRWLAAFGYALFAAGLLGNGFMRPADDFWQLAWQQAARGAALMLCLLPTTSFALGAFPPDSVANASGLFNLLRNLGGAIGLAVVNTLINERTPAHVAALVARLEAGDPAAARFVGLPLDRFHGHPIGPVDQATRDLVAPLVEHAGLTLSLNEAWLLVGGLVLASLLFVPFVRRQPRYD
ncbi:MAG TPA: DHA2 family efflux MFS transporter permease subunit [Stellaceae bacterium]|nr:DHA2 family efflux MFS transporter permease subunit [Stellaceae bacterium]